MNWRTYTDSELHDLGWSDEREGKPWPDNPGAVYTLARERAIESRKIDLSVRHCIAMMGMNWPKVS